MTVSTSVNKIIYPGTGAQTVFTFSFAFPFGTATQETANFQVFYTDTLGNITLLTQGPGTTQYQITFNPPTGTNPTPAGGQVTYNPSGTPIALGTFLTIFRNMPLAQNTSLANQGTQYQPVIEGALDYDVMLSQQVLEVQSRAFVVPISDPAPATVPAVAARKNQGAVWDSNGNLTAGVLPSSGVISSAMAPVVSAATLAAGRTAFGLGAVATQGIGLGTGLVAFGGELFVENTIVTDSSTPITLGANDINSNRLATIAVTYNLPSIASVGNANIWFWALGGQLTLAPSGSDSFVGNSAGQALSVPQGMQAIIFTNGVSWYILMAPIKSVDAPSNLQIITSVASSALTIAIKDRNGLDATQASPILFAFSNGGAITPRAVTTPLSITVPNGATLGTVNGQANRIWVGLFDNAGSPVLGVYNSLSGSNILCWNEANQTNGTAVFAGSTNAQTWYTASGVTAKNFRILGYIESTQPTAGAWTATPSAGQLFGPGIKKPGDIVQTAQAAGAASISISPSNASNVIKFITSGYIPAPGAPASTVTWKRGAGTLTSQVLGASGAGIVGVPIPLVIYDLPNVTSSTTYSITSSNGTITNPVLIAEEIFI